MLLSVFRALFIVNLAMIVLKMLSVRTVLAVNLVKNSTAMMAFVIDSMYNSCLIRFGFRFGDRANLVFKPKCYATIIFVINLYFGIIFYNTNDKNNSCISASTSNLKFESRFFLQLQNLLESRHTDP